MYGNFPKKINLRIFLNFMFMGNKTMKNKKFSKSNKMQVQVLQVKRALMMFVGQATYISYKSVVHQN